MKKNFYDQIATDFSESRKNFWNEFYLFEKYLSKKIKVLDIGCGNGRLYSFLQEKINKYIGIDVSQKLIDIAQNKYPKVCFKKMDMVNLKTLSTKKFDIIFFIASFHHLSSEAERITVLKQAKNLLSEQGIICMTNWNLFQKKYKKHIWKAIFKSLFSSYKWNDVFIPFTGKNSKILRYYHAFTPKELENLFKNVDLQIQEKTFFNKNKSEKNWRNCRNFCYVLKNSNTI